VEKLKRYPMYFGIILLDSTYMPPFTNIDCWGIAGVTRKYDSIARDVWIYHRNIYMYIAGAV